MQAPEFDNLMNGNAAKFADMFDQRNNIKGLGELLSRAKQNDATPADIEAAREEIKKQEVEIPGPLRFKIDMFIQQQKQAGKSDRAIRRLVQRKFNITVI